jgi:hypothetical protein
MFNNTFTHILHQFTQQNYEKLDENAQEAIYIFYKGGSISSSYDIDSQVLTATVVITDINNELHFFHIREYKNPDYDYVHLNGRYFYIYK